MRRSNRTGRAAAGFVALALMGLAGGVALAQEAGPQPAPAPMTGAEISDAGWWNRLRPQIDLPTGQPPAPPTPGVPPGSLVVGASVGEPDAVVAIGIDPELADGATVDRFELTVREVPDDGANLNTTFAALVACPITGFWIGGENAVWETRPDHDCSLASAPGTRADDGTWTFDLRPIGQLWSDGTTAAEGVALVEAVEPPTAFRTVLAGLGDLAIGVVLEASGGDEATDPFDSAPPGSFGGGGAGTGSSGGTGGGGRGSGSSSGGFSPGGIGGGTVATTATTTPTTAPPTDVEPEVALPTVPIAGPPSPLGSLPWWSLPLLAVAVGLAVLAMVALGPSGDPVLAAGTGRGVTRAIEARSISEEP